MTHEPVPASVPPLPGFRSTLIAAVLAALTVSLFIGIIIVAGFKDESLEMLPTVVVFGTVFGLPYALLVAVLGPRLAGRARTPTGRVVVWLAAGFVSGASILAIPSALLGSLAGHAGIAVLFGGFGALGSMVLMAMLGRR